MRAPRRQRTVWRKMGAGDGAADSSGAFWTACGASERSYIVAGVPGISENIHINGIIDRYLEHSRIFIFANGGEEKYYIGSADWMPRNLDNRIEVAAPVYDKEIQADLKRIVCYGFRDTAKGRIVDGTGENREKEREENSVPFRSQEKLYNEYKNTL